MMLSRTIEVSDDAPKHLHMQPRREGVIRRTDGFGNQYVQGLRNSQTYG